MSSIGPLVLIDGHNTFIRNYVRSPYTDENGERMGGTTGMVISVRKLISDLRASNCLVIWDGEGGSQRRRSIQSTYKEGRTVRLNVREDEGFEETPEQRLENMRKQRQLASDYLTILGVPQVRCDGVEADDIMAYLAKELDPPGGTVVVTTDQDLLQMIRKSSYEHSDDCSGALCNVDDPSCCPDSSGKHICSGSITSEVRVWSPIKKKMYDHKLFVEEYGVLPENFRMVKALTGDSSDNIEGIKGFGTKTVAKTFPDLGKRYVQVDELLAMNDSLKSAVSKRLTAEKNRFLENLKMVDLSEPMLSATAARQAREALDRDLGCKEVEFRMRVIKDSVSFGGDNFVGPFREFVLRRRRIIPATPPVADQTNNKENGE